MQVNVAASQFRVVFWLSFRLDPLSNCFRRRPAALMIAVLLLFSSLSNPGFCAENTLSGFQRLFHLVGIPGLKRDSRVDLTPESDGLLFHTSKVQYRVPYARIHQLLLLPSDRRYEGRTYAAALATYGVGSLLILKKHHVDTIVLDYVNERGGKMGIVVQMETSQGEQFGELMKSRGISIIGPEDLKESTLKDETGSQPTGGSKQ